jgi:glycosyltransferase involved in cell wall biosynthesis
MAGTGLILLKSFEIKYMVALHFITNSFPPDEGGLEKRLLRLVNNFSENGYQVFVYICNSDTDVQKYMKVANPQVKIKVTGFYRKVLEEPIRLSNFGEHRITKERFRIDTLILRNFINKEISEYPENKHVIISNYLTTCGYLAMNVCEDLEIPHIATIVGTDFSRGFKNPDERYLIEKVLENAHCVITLNEEFSKMVRNVFPSKRIFKIHGSVPEASKTFRWKAQQKVASSLALFSDCGFCHKKGTQILLWAFSRLLRQGIEAKLVLCGKTNLKQARYWQELRKQYQDEFGDRILFYDYLPHEALNQLFLESDLYCYPTLSEGCSNSRIAALCIGIPMITTWCGEIVDVINNVSHIKTCLPGDHIDFYELLYKTCLEYSAGNIHVDECHLNSWHLHFSIGRETADWNEAINYTIGIQ